MDWIQIHLALNHVPVIGMPILLLLLAIGWWRKSDEVIRLMLWSITLLSVAAIIIKFTGDFAAEQSPDFFAEAKQFVAHHEQTADQATTGVFLLGIAAGGALFMTRSGKPVPRWTLSVVLAFGIVTMLLYVRTAHAGGEIRHSELRN